MTDAPDGFREPARVGRRLPRAAAGAVVDP
jgi:hypothetical protein